MNFFSRRRFLAAGAAATLCSRAATPADERIEAILRSLTLEEKIRLCHGNVTKDSFEQFHAGGVPRLGIGQIKMLDGRQGIRPLDKTTQTTALPCTLSLSCTWDPETASAFSGVLAEELLSMGQHILLGPCMNLARSPLGGRNFENLGEDPFLAGVMAAAYIQGAQQVGVAGCACILVANDCETWRHFTSSNMDERTLHEMHLLPFEMSITDGHAWAIMTANNLLNGVHIAASRRLLRDIVKDQLGFDGVVLTDWRAAYDPEPSALAGIDMTTGFCAYVFGDGRLLAAVKSGKVPEAAIDEKVRRILRLYNRTGVLDPHARAKGEPEGQKHRALARKLAAEGMVLLKNERRLLPLDPGTSGSVLVTGPAAEMVPFGGGSGAVRPPFQITPMEGLKAALGDRVKTASKDSLIEAGRAASVVLFFARDAQHGEGNDMTSLELPEGQAKTIGELAAVNPNVVVILLTGQAVSLEPWADRVPAILAAWYAGQSTGDAIADVLTGKFNPTGRLPLSWPRHVGQVPIVYNERPAGRPYAPGVHYSSTYLDAPPTPQFPFGHGLSYTRFALSDLQCEPALVKAGDAVEVSLAVHNEGALAGETTLFLFVRDPVASLARPVLELKGVQKAVLAAGERRQVKWRLSVEDLAFIGQNLERVLEPGRFEIHVGLSADPGDLVSSAIELVL